MEWIYTQTKIRGQGSLELALEEKKIKKLALSLLNLSGMPMGGSRAVLRVPVNPPPLPWAFHWLEWQWLTGFLAYEPKASNYYIPDKHLSTKLE